MEFRAVMSTIKVNSYSYVASNLDGKVLTLPTSVVFALLGAVLLLLLIL